VEIDQRWDAPHVRFTVLLYPFRAFWVPLNVAVVWSAGADCGELLIVSE
jgi:hypothetical protein